MNYSHFSYSLFPFFGYLHSILMELLFLLFFKYGRHIKIIIMRSNCKTCNYQKDINEILVVSQLFVIIHECNESIGTVAIINN